jgi:hypothetical protein
MLITVSEMIPQIAGHGEPPHVSQRAMSNVLLNMVRHSGDVLLAR